MTGKIQFKMRPEPTRLRVAPTTESPTPRDGSGSFDLEALAALEAALGTLGGPLPSAPVPRLDVTTTQPGLRTARELIAAMDTAPDRSPVPMTALDWTQPPSEAEPPSLPRIEPAPARAEPKELRNGDLPARPVAPVAPERPRRAPAPPLEPPDFQLSVAKPRRFRWPFGR